VETRSQKAPSADELAPLGEIWMRSPNRFLRAAATEAHARSPLIENRLPVVLRSLDDEQAYNRTLALIVVERLLGRKVSRDEYDLLAAPPERSRRIEALVQALHAGL
jgi:hypothetical protein